VPDFCIRQADQFEQVLVESSGDLLDCPQRRVSPAAQEVEVIPPADAELRDEALGIRALRLELLQADCEDLRQDRVLALAGFRLSPTVEQAFELAIGEIPHLIGDDGALTRDEQHLGGGVHVADFVWCHERAGDVLFAIGDS